MKLLNLKRAIAITMSVSLLLTSVGCSSKTSASDALYTPGTYSASEKDFGGNVTVAITVDSSKITDVKVEGPNETANVGGAALSKLADGILKAQSSEIDTVSGATITSNAVVSAAASAIAQAKGEAAQTAQISFKPGTYTGKGKGFGGELVLDVTFAEDSITDIKLVSSKETEHVGTPAFDIMFEEIKNFTSTGVDVVSGATFSSNAVLTAVEDAAAQAGCEVSALRQGKKPYEVVAGDKITETYDVVIVGAGGAGVAAGAAAAQKGATVCIVEKESDAGGNTLVAGCSYQSVMDCLVWDASNPDAVTGVYEPTGETFDKAKSDQGRLETLRTILNWSEEPFDVAVKDPSAIKDVDDYELPNRGVHKEYLETLQTLKKQIKAYLTWADAKMAAGVPENELTLFSTVELHIFQTYYGGLRLNNDKTEWIYGNYELVKQVCSEIPSTKEWLMDQGALFKNATATGTLIGCLWQRINGFDGGNVDAEKVEGKWGTYFAVPINTILKANEKNKLMYRTKATELITDATGKVTGVKAVKYDGTEVELTASSGVILATGGYACNIDMVIETNEYWDKDDLTSAIKTTNRSLAQGEGITMATAAGAATTGMEFTQLMPIGWANTGNLAGGKGENVIFISPAGTENAGKRYVDESAERDVLAQGAYDFGGENGLFIQISNAGEKTSKDNVEEREYFCTLSEAAEMLDIDADVIKKTIVEYDDAVRNGTIDKMKVPKSAAIGFIGNYKEDGSFNDEGLLSIRYLAPSTHHTMGGLVVDTYRHVLNKDGKIIEGLYAAGEVTGGIFAGNRLGGNAISEILVSGKIAGENAASK